MEGNRDEAKRALNLAKSYHTSDPAKALKFARKACALYWSPEAAGLVKALETGEGPSASASNNEPTATSSSTKSSAPNSDQHLRSRPTPKPTSSNQSSSPPNYKPSQLELVKKVRRHKVTQYYEILDLKRDCDESQIKSAYRKLALALHPDKNNAPGADEAFKMVSKAFQVLSDADKRSAYDRHGADPDSRSAGVSSTSTGFGAGRRGAQFGYEEGIDPEQLFRMFFGGGGGFDHPGMQFGGGPTVFQFGGSGPTFRRAGSTTWSNQRNRNQPVEVRSASTWLSLLPIALFFLVSLFQSFPSLFSTSVPNPSISWTPNSVYPVQRVTHTSPGISCQFCSPPFGLSLTPVPIKAY